MARSLVPLDQVVNRAYAAAEGCSKLAHSRSPLLRAWGEDVFSPPDVSDACCRADEVAWLATREAYLLYR